MIVQFPAFPEFIELKIGDKQSYESLVSKHPPYSDILFATLHIWWNLGDELRIAILNDNVVIDYHQPFDKPNSGFGLIGVSHIDDSIETIFKFLSDHGKPVKIIHTPQFVIRHISDKHKYKLSEERDYFEYILNVADLANLEGSKAAMMRKKINRFLRRTEGKEIKVGSVPIASEEGRKTILSALRKWENDRPAYNDPDRTEHIALEQSLRYSKELGLHNLAVFLDSELIGFTIYHRPYNKKYYVMHHLRVSYDIPYVSDYIYNELAKRGLESGIQYINIEMDLGIENLRNHKQEMRPVKFFRKYTITPA